MIDELNIRYVTDESGNKKAVQISYKDWIEIEKKLNEYIEYQRLKEGLTEAFEEVKELKNNKEDRVSLNEFLNEC